jgi:hypothetical protein
MQRTFLVRDRTAATMTNSRDETLWTLIRRIRFAMLTTRSADGALRSRPLTTQNRSLVRDTKNHSAGSAVSAGKLIQLLAMAKAVASGTRPQVGVHHDFR